MQFANDKDAIYGAFLDYFGDIKMGKIKVQDSFAVYATKCVTGLSDNRYIFAVVPDNAFLSEEANLNSLNWVSLQTRTVDSHYKVPSVTLLINEQMKKALPDILQVVDRNIEKTEYVVKTIPIKVTLMHNIKQKNSLQFPDQCKLYQALETYNCVVEMY